jgi:hypothetical protein
MFKRFGEHRRNIAHWGMELVIVVTGVLIALGAQQWAENRSSEAKAKAAEARIKLEAQANLMQGIHRIALRECLRERLAVLADGLQSGRSDWSSLLDLSKDDAGQMVFQRLYRMPSRIWVDHEYRGSMATGSLATISPERASILAGFYGQVANQGAFNSEEERLGVSVAVLQFKRPLSAAERDRLLGALTRLDYLNSLMVIVARQSAESYKQLYPRLTAQEVASLRKARAWPSMIASMRDVYGPCVDPEAIKVFDPRLAS